MLTLRCTQRLLTRLKHKAATDAPPSTTRLGDWYANLLYVNQKQLALLVSERSLLAVLIPARELANLPASLTSAFTELMGAMGAPRKAMEVEVARMQELSFGPTANRSVLGSMNDMIFAVKFLLSHSPEKRLIDLAIDLGETPYSALKYKYPRDVAVELLAGTNSARLRSAKKCSRNAATGRKPKASDGTP